MEENNNTMENKEVKKFSYEELENICKQLSEQNDRLFKALNEANLTNMFKRLDYLLKIVEYREAFSKSFVESCVKELEEGLTVPENNTNKEQN